MARAQRPRASFMPATQAQRRLQLMIVAGLCIHILPHVAHDAVRVSPPALRASEARPLRSILRGGSLTTPGKVHQPLEIPAAMTPKVPEEVVEYETRVHRAVAALNEPAMALPRHWPPGAKAPVVAPGDTFQQQQVQVTPHQAITSQQFQRQQTEQVFNFFINRTLFIYNTQAASTHARDLAHKHFSNSIRRSPCRDKAKRNSCLYCNNLCRRLVVLLQLETRHLQQGLNTCRRPLRSCWALVKDPAHCTARSGEQGVNMNNMARQRPESRPGEYIILSDAGGAPVVGVKSTRNSCENFKFTDIQNSTRENEGGCDKMHVTKHFILEQEIDRKTD